MPLPALLEVLHSLAILVGAIQLVEVAFLHITEVGLFSCSSIIELLLRKLAISWHHALLHILKMLSLLLEGHTVVLGRDCLVHGRITYTS